MRISRLIMMTIALCLAAQASAQSLVVYAVNYPLAWMAERVGGAEVEVRFPVPAGEDPAFWDPSPDDIVGFRDADLILLNGAGYAKWVAGASLPRRKLVDTSAAFADRLIRVDGDVVHSHGPGGDHSHAGVAFTTWLDPAQAVLQARAAEQAMARALPQKAEVFAARLAGLEDDLEELDGQLRDAFSGLDGGTLLASHPVYQYLARRYGLDVDAFAWEPDTPPDDVQWRLLETLLESQPSSVMLWEAEPLPATRERLAAAGVAIVVFSPAMNRPAQGDFLDVMRANVDAVRAAAAGSR